MENHARVMVVRLSFNQLDVCARISSGKRTTPTRKDTCLYLDSRSNHGNLLAKNSPTFLELDL
jgi:hypothetical protein